MSIVGASWRVEMAAGWAKVVWLTILVVAIVAPHFTAQPPLADDAIESDRQARQSAIKSGKRVATAQKRGFFGTIFNLILEQINDTRSAYTQVSDLVNAQFIDDSMPTKVPMEVNGTTESPKISRAEFLRIIDRNLKGLNRLRNLEWREAKKDSFANLRGYKDELFRGKKLTKR